MHFIILVLIAAGFLLGDKLTDIGAYMTERGADYLYVLFSVLLLIAIMYCYFYFENKEMLSSGKNIALIFTILDVYFIIGCLIGEKIDIDKIYEMISFDQESSIQALNTMETQVNTNQTDYFTVFAALNPIYLGKNEFFEIGGDLNDFAELLNRLQQMDVYYVNSACYKRNDESIFNITFVGVGYDIGGRFGHACATDLTAIIGNFGMIVLLLAGWVITGVFINRNFIHIRSYYFFISILCFWF